VTQARGPYDGTEHGMTGQTRSTPRRGGFSLVELIIAAGLGMIILLVVATSLNSVSRAVTISQASVSLNTRARAIIKHIEQDIEAVHPKGVLDPAAGGDELKMCVCVPTLDRDYNGILDGNDWDHEFVWVHYKYDSTNKILRKGTAQVDDRTPDGTLEDLHIFPSSTPPLQLFSTNIKALTFEQAAAPADSSRIEVTFTLEDPESGIEREFAFVARPEPLLPVP
jgi:type II secretory pathway pseudopilin PulG